MQQADSRKLICELVSEAAEIEYAWATKYSWASEYAWATSYIQLCSQAARIVSRRHWLTTSNFIMKSMAEQLQLYHRLDLIDYKAV